jgi:GTP pyrophosphokinase
MEKESRLHKNQEFEHILFSIGDGSIHSEEVRRWFADDPSSVTGSNSESPLHPKNKAKTRKKRITESPSTNKILVDGMDNVMTRIAKCCSPDKSHSNQGYLTLERVITIHKYSCAYLQKLTPERMVKVRWGNRK